MSISLGVIGTGSAFRRLHLPVLQKTPEDFRIVALANRTRAKAEQFATEISGAKVYDDYRALLDDPNIEAVLIAVPIEFGAKVFTEAIAAGKHVLAEKPIAATVMEGREILRVAKRATGVIAIAENFRYREDVIKAREIIAAGEIGDVYCFQITTKFDLLTDFRRPWFQKGTWRHSPSHPGISMISDMGVHVISSLRDILGDVSELYAQLLDTAPATEGPDCMLVQLTLSSNAVGHYLACYSAKVIKETVFDFTAFGKTGSLQLTEGEVQWLRAPGTPALTYRPDGYDRGYKNQWRNFYRAIRGEEAVVSTPEQAYRDLLVIDAARRSACTGEKVRVDSGAEDIE
jgi:predicted dehydrogenase